MASSSEEGSLFDWSLIDPAEETSLLMAMAAAEGHMTVTDRAGSLTWAEAAAADDGTTVMVRAETGEPYTPAPSDAASPWAVPCDDDSVEAAALAAIGDLDDVPDSERYDDDTVADSDGVIALSDSADESDAAVGHDDERSVAANAEAEKDAVVDDDDDEEEEEEEEEEGMEDYGPAPSHEYAATVSDGMESRMHSCLSHVLPPWAPAFDAKKRRDADGSEGGSKSPKTRRAEAPGSAALPDPEAQPEDDVMDVYDTQCWVVQHVARRRKATKAEVRAWREAGLLEDEDALFHDVDDIAAGVFQKRAPGKANTTPSAGAGASAKGLSPDSLDFHVYLTVWAPILARGEDGARYWHVEPPTWERRVWLVSHGYEAMVQRADAEAKVVTVRTATPCTKPRPPRAPPQARKPNYRMHDYAPCSFGSMAADPSTDGGITPIPGKRLPDAATYPHRSTDAETARAKAAEAAAAKAAAKAAAEAKKRRTQDILNRQRARQQAKNDIVRQQRGIIAAPVRQTSLPNRPLRSSAATLMGHCNGRHFFAIARAGHPSFESFLAYVHSKLYNTGYVMYAAAMLDPETLATQVCGSSNMSRRRAPRVMVRGTKPPDNTAVQHASERRVVEQRVEKADADAAALRKERDDALACDFGSDEDEGDAEADATSPTKAPKKKKKPPVVVPPSGEAPPDAAASSSKNKKSALTKDTASWGQNLGDDRGLPHSTINGGTKAIVAFHGTAPSNFPSIAQRGLLVPGSTSGVRVRNGSAYGIGVYSCRDPGTPCSYASGNGVVLVCVAGPPSVESGWLMVHGLGRPIVPILAVRVGRIHDVDSDVRVKIHNAELGPAVCASPSSLFSIPRPHYLAS